MAFFFVPYQIDDVFFLRTALGEQLKKVPIVCMGIEVCEKLLEFGAQNVSFFELPESSISKLNRAHLSATTLARSFDALHSELRIRHLGLDTSSVGWDYLNVFFIAESILVLKGVLDSFIEKIPPLGNPVFFRRNNPQDLYFDSGLVRGLVNRKLRARFANVAAMDLGCPPHFRKEASKFELIFPEGVFKVLGHMPTAFYSAEKHRQRILGGGSESVVDLQSAYFDLPISDNRIRLGPPVAHRTRQMPAGYVSDLEVLTRDFYAALGVSPEAEACGMIERHRQWATSHYHAYIALSEASCLSEVERVETTCHDAGLAGPLLSWANARRIPVEMWPHSEVINIPTPVLKAGRKHSFFREHPLELELGVGNSEWVDLKQRDSDSPKGKQTLLILLNQMDAAGGVPRCRVFELKRALQSAVEDLISKGWQVRLRQKPSHPYRVLMHVDSVEPADGPLEGWAEWPEVCLSIVGPTSAMFHFWKNGVRCFHLQQHALAASEEFLLPSEGVEIYHSAPYSLLLSRFTNALTGA